MYSYSIIFHSISWYFMIFHCTYFIIVRSIPTNLPGWYRPNEHHISPVRHFARRRARDRRKRSSDSRWPRWPFWTQRVKRQHGKSLGVDLHNRNPLGITLSSIDGSLWKFVEIYLVYSLHRTCSVCFSIFCFFGCMETRSFEVWELGTIGTWGFVANILLHAIYAM